MTKSNDYGGLSQKQIQALPLIAPGLTDEAVAESVGVTRQTVNKWKNHDLEFKDFLDYERVQLWQSYQDRSRALFPKALKILEDSLESENERIRVTVALAIFKSLKEVPLMAEIKHPNPEKGSVSVEDKIVKNLLMGL
jgi:hypothetical protein